MNGQSIEVDLDWFELFFESNVDAVFNVAHRLLWNRADAEDVVQVAFVKALTNRDQLREPDRERPWLLQIAYRESVSTMRRRRDLPTDPGLHLEREHVAPGPADAAVASDMARIVSIALAGLDESERLAVTLRDVESLPMGDVALVMGIGVSAAKMRVHRGRAKLRTVLQKDVGHAM